MNQERNYFRFTGILDSCLRLFSDLFQHDSSKLLNRCKDCQSRHGDVASQDSLRLLYSRADGLDKLSEIPSSPADGLYYVNQKSK